MLFPLNTILAVASRQIALATILVLSGAPMAAAQAPAPHPDRNGLTQDVPPGGPATTAPEPDAPARDLAASETVGLVARSGSLPPNVPWIVEPAHSEPLLENAWDFTNPDSIPGFASHPYPRPFGHD